MASGRFSDRDLTHVGGLTVTTPLRTAWDLGRLAHRDRAIGALDALLRHGSVRAGRARRRRAEASGRMRGVVQLRALAPCSRTRVGVAGRVDAAAAVARPDQPASPDASGVDHGRAASRSTGSTSACPSSASAVSTTARRSTSTQRRTARVARISGRGSAGRWSASDEANLFGPTRDVEEILQRGDLPGARGRIGTSDVRRSERNSRRVGTARSRTTRLGTARSQQLTPGRHRSGSRNPRRVSGGRSGSGGSRRRRTRRAGRGRG